MRTSRLPRPARLCSGIADISGITQSLNRDSQGGESRHRHLARSLAWTESPHQPLIAVSHVTTAALFPCLPLNTARAACRHVGDMGYAIRDRAARFSFVSVRMGPQNRFGVDRYISDPQRALMSNEINRQAEKNTQKRYG